MNNSFIPNALVHYPNPNPIPTPNLNNNPKTVGCVGLSGVNIEFYLSLTLFLKAFLVTVMCS